MLAAIDPFAYPMRPFSRSSGMLEVHLLTLFPEAVQPYLDASILGRAGRADLLRVHVHNFRGYTTDKHSSVDDRPFGGGPGMVLRCGPIFSAIESVEKQFGVCRKILLSPDGQPFRQSEAQGLVQEERLPLVVRALRRFRRSDSARLRLDRVLGRRLCARRRGTTGTVRCRSCCTADSRGTRAQRIRCARVLHRSELA